MQERLSLARENSSPHAHEYVPSSFTHCCSHPPFSVSHSLSSVKNINLMLMLKQELAPVNESNLVKVICFLFTKSNHLAIFDHTSICSCCHLPSVLVQGDTYNFLLALIQCDRIKIPTQVLPSVIIQCNAYPHRYCHLYPQCTPPCSDSCRTLGCCDRIPDRCEFPGNTHLHLLK